MTVAKALPEDLIGEHGLLKQLTKALVERAQDAEMAAHLGHAKSEPVKLHSREFFSAEQLVRFLHGFNGGY